MLRETIAAATLQLFAGRPLPVIITRLSVSTEYLRGSCNQQAWRIASEYDRKTWTSGSSETCAMRTRSCQTVADKFVIMQMTCRRSFLFPISVSQTTTSSFVELRRRFRSSRRAAEQGGGRHCQTHIQSLPASWSVESWSRNNLSAARCGVSLPRVRCYHIEPQWQRLRRADTFIASA